MKRMKACLLLITMVLSVGLLYSCNLGGNDTEKPKVVTSVPDVDGSTVLSSNTDSAILDKIAVALDMSSANLKSVIAKFLNSSAAQSGGTTLDDFLAWYNEQNDNKNGGSAGGSGSAPNEPDFPGDFVGELDRGTLMGLIGDGDKYEEDLSEAAKTSIGDGTIADYSGKAVGGLNCGRTIRVFYAYRSKYLNKYEGTTYIGSGQFDMNEAFGKELEEFAKTETLAQFYKFNPQYYNAGGYLIDDSSNISAYRRWHQEAEQRNNVITGSRKSEQAEDSEIRIFICSDYKVQKEIDGMCTMQQIEDVIVELAAKLQYSLEARKGHFGAGYITYDFLYEPKSEEEFQNIIGYDGYTAILMYMVDADFWGGTPSNVESSMINGRTTQWEDFYKTSIAQEFPSAKFIKVNAFGEEQLPESEWRNYIRPYVDIDHKLYNAKYPPEEGHGTVNWWLSCGYIGNGTTEIGSQYYDYATFLNDLKSLKEWNLAFQIDALSRDISSFHEIHSPNNIGRQWLTNEIKDVDAKNGNDKLTHYILTPKMDYDDQFGFVEGKEIGVSKPYSCLVVLAKNGKLVGIVGDDNDFIQYRDWSYGMTPDGLSNYYTHPVTGETLVKTCDPSQDMIRLYLQNKIK